MDQELKEVPIEKPKYKAVPRFPKFDSITGREMALRGAIVRKAKAEKRKLELIEALEKKLGQVAKKLYRSERQAKILIQIERIDGLILSARDPEKLLTFAKVSKTLHETLETVCGMEAKQAKTTPARPTPDDSTPQPIDLLAQPDSVLPPG